LKSRVVGLLGRIGSILITMGLALTLVLSIPGKPVTGTYPPSRHIYPHSCAYIFPPSDIPVPSPQYGLRISVTLNSSLQIYFVAIHPLQLREQFLSWIKEHYPLLNETQTMMGMYNASVLGAFLQTRPPEEILLTETVNGEWSIDFFPRKATNVTVVFSNPSLVLINVDVEMTGIAIPMPKYHALMITQTLLVSGTVSTVPWAAKKSKDYVRSR